MGQIGIAHQRADPGAAIGPHLDPVQAGQPAQINQPAGLLHTDLHQVDQVCPAAQIGGVGRPCGNGIGHRGGPDIIELSHADVSAWSDAMRRVASHTAWVIP